PSASVHRSAMWSCLWRSVRTRSLPTPTVAARLRPSSRGFHRMRRLANLLWFTSALLVLLVGLAGAALSGPDDTVEVVSDKVGDARGVPLVTAPVLTDVTGLDVVVTAGASGGVFVGATHRVDLDDL